jgi:SAM-dependent methyltransferase
MACETSLSALLPDYSEYLRVPANLENEEREWALHKAYERNANTLLHFANLNDCRSVLELGCGTGWIPYVLGGRLGYRGIDANEYCLQLCHNKNPGELFAKADIRTLDWRFRADVVCCFAVLKHFGLHEWDEVAASVIERGRHSLFTVQIADEDFDDGTEYPHSWITMERLERVVSEAGHSITTAEVWATAEKGNEYLVWTTRNSPNV